MAVLQSTSLLNIQKINEMGVSNVQDEVAIEEPLEIRIIYNLSGSRIEKNISVTMRTPGNDQELALGFLFTEGIIQGGGQIESIHSKGNDDSISGNVICVKLCEGVLPSLASSERNFYTTSSCGVCGKASIEAITTHSQFKGITSQSKVTPMLIYELQSTLRKHQKTFERTGGLHASALFSEEGELQILREDVGRHNALDKVIGIALQGKLLPLDRSILLLSGRASFELIQKAVMAGIKIVVAIGAPSSLAVQVAIENDLTLIGFLREKNFNIYSGRSRILTG